MKCKSNKKEGINDTGTILRIVAAGNAGSGVHPNFPANTGHCLGGSD